MLTFKTDNPSSCGIVKKDSEGKVIEFYEKYGPIWFTGFFSKIHKTFNSYVHFRLSWNCIAIKSITIYYFRKLYFKKKVLRIFE